MAAPTITSAQFQAPDPAAVGGPWTLCVYAQGSGFVERARPLVATVGSIAVQAVVVSAAGDGFVGFLAQTPNDGDVLSVGYDEIVATDIAYHAGVA